MSTNEELAMQAKDGDRDALLMLWHQVSRFARYKTRGFGTDNDADDLAQVSFAALLRAVEGFDPAKGKFTTHYGFALKNAHRGVLPKQTDALRYAESIDAPITEDGDPLAVFLPDESASVDRKTERDELVEAVRIALNALLPQEQAVILCRYWKRLTPEKTAQALNLTDVRRVEATALRKLRHPSVSRPLRRFVYD